MNRKEFLSVAIPSGIALSAFSLDTKAAPVAASGKIPAYLSTGDTIGITSPAGFITLEDIAPSVQLMEQWGYQVRIGQTIGKRDFTFGGTDAERLADLQQMLDDPTVKAIMCARGGYGMARIIDQLDFRRYKRQPKWIIGFSDITVAHAHINRHFKIPTIHSKMCNSFPKDWAAADEMQVNTILSIKLALSGAQMHYTAPAIAANKPGKAVGVLVGGNLRTLENMAGTASQMKTSNKLLFLEDTGEPLYSIDRMFLNLRRTGMLEHLAGLIVGGFKLKAEPPDDFGRSLYEIVAAHTQQYNYPVCFDFPVGHQKNNFALKCGILHQLEINETGTTLTSL